MATVTSKQIKDLDKKLSETKNEKLKKSIERKMDFISKDKTVKK